MPTRCSENNKSFLLGKVLFVAIPVGIVFWSINSMNNYKKHFTQFLDAFARTAVEQCQHGKCPKEIWVETPHFAATITGVRIVAMENLGVKGIKVQGEVNFTRHDGEDVPPYERLSYSDMRLSAWLAGVNVSQMKI